MRPTFELFDHTADMGFRVRAASLGGLLAPAARALYAVVGDLVAAGAPNPIPIDLKASDAATLLRDYLAELLHLLDRDDRIAIGVDVERFTDSRLIATVETDRLDETRSVADREVKAITYHELAIRSIPGGFEATVIVDI